MSEAGGFITNDSITMMRTVLEHECVLRGISSRGIEAEDIAVVLIHAFTDGLKDEAELTTLVRNLCDRIGIDGRYHAR